MKYYDLIEVNKGIRFYYYWNSDGKINETGFSNKYNNIRRDNYKQVEDYFRSYFFDEKELPDITYDISIKLTDFEQSVLNQTKKIPRGATLRYKDISKKINKPLSYRAVGNALGKNPLPVIIPCHRVVGVDGLGGFSAGLEIKKFLLTLEGIL